MVLSPLSVHLTLRLFSVTLARYINQRQQSASISEYLLEKSMKLVFACEDQAPTHTQPFRRNRVYADLQEPYCSLFVQIYIGLMLK